MMLKKIFLVLLAVFWFWPAVVRAQPADEEVLEGRVVASVEENVVYRDKETYLYQKLKVMITKGSLAGEEVEIEAGEIPIVGQPKYRPGDRVLITFSHDFEGNRVLLITDYVRRLPLLILFGVFVVLAVVVGGWRGASSLLGLAISFGVIS